MTKTLILVGLFLLCNFIGSTIGALFYIMPGHLGLIDINAENFNIQTWQNDMAVGVFGVWVLCGLFSFAAFFTHAAWRVFFLTMPIIAPTLFGAIKLISHL